MVQSFVRDSAGTFSPGPRKSSKSRNLYLRYTHIALLKCTVKFKCRKTPRGVASFIFGMERALLAVRRLGMRLTPGDY